MKTIGKLAGFALSILLLGACSSQTKQVESRSSSSQVTVPSSLESSSNKNRETSSSQEVVPDESLTKADERTEPNPPLPPEVVDKLMKGEMGEASSESSSEPNTSLARKKMLPVNAQLQEVWYYCAPTTVSMMLASRGMLVNQYQLAKEMGTYEPYGTHNRDAIRILNRHLFGYEQPADGQAGYRLATVMDASHNSEDMRLFKERVRKDIDDGYPLYYTFMVEQMYPGKKGEHNVIGIGYELTADGQDVSAIYYLDPSPSVQDATYGGLKKVTPEEMLSAMVTAGEPNYAW